MLLIGRRKERLDRLVTEIEAAHGVRVRGQVLDVRDRDRVTAFAQRLDAEGVAVDFLVNNAGLARGLDTLQEGKHEDWDEMIDTNIKGVLNMSRAFLPGMIERDVGHVVNIGSIAGHVAYPKGNVYNATKFAIKGLTQAANMDLVGTNVKFSSVDPGLVQTEFSLVRFRGDGERAETVYEGVESLLAQDVADAVHYVLNTPPRVNILHMVVMPTVQRSPFVISRESQG